MTVIDLRNDRFPVRDLSLPHQIDFEKADTHRLELGGLGVVVTCNCKWRSHRTIRDVDDAWALYRDHLS